MLYQNNEEMPHITIPSSTTNSYKNVISWKASLFIVLQCLIKDIMENIIAILEQFGSNDAWGKAWSSV